MIKSVIRIALSYFLIFGQTIAYAQSTAAILPQGKTQFFNNNGDPLTSGKVFFYVPSTTTTKTTWQDSSKLVANANPVILDGGGRAIIYGDGTYRQIVKDRNNNTIYDAVTASAGTGGGTTGTGDGDLVGTIKPWAGLVAPNQYAFAYGQEISRTTYSVLYTAITLQQTISCTSGNATAAGFSDTSQIPTGAIIESLCFAPGTTVVSKTATTVTFNNNSTLSTSDNVRIFLYGNGNGSTTFNLPDLRGNSIIGRTNMGGVASTNLNSNFYGTNPQAMGAVGGRQYQFLLTGNLPAYTPTGTISSITPAGTISQITPAGTISQITPAGTVTNAASGTTTYTPTGTPTAVGTVTKPTITSSIAFSSSGTNSYTPTGTNAASALTLTNGTSIVQATGTTLNLTASGALGQAVSISGTAAGQTFTGNAVTGAISSALDATPTFTNSGSTFAGNSTTFSFAGTPVTPTFTGTPVTPTFTGTLITPTFTGVAQGGISADFGIVGPSITLNYIIKIIPDSNSADASGVTSLGGMTGDIACGSGLLCTGNIVSSTSGVVIQPYAGAVTRTVQNKINEFVTVADFGAVGDGVTDDAVHIQAAINAMATLPNGGSVIVDCKTYAVSTTIIITNGVQLEGQCNGGQRALLSSLPTTTFKWIGTCCGPVLLMEDQYSGIVKNIWINANFTAQVGIWTISPQSATFENLSVQAIAAGSAFGFNATGWYWEGSAGSSSARNTLNNVLIEVFANTVDGMTWVGHMTAGACDGPITHTNATNLFLEAGAGGTAFKIVQCADTNSFYNPQFASGGAGGVALALLMPTFVDGTFGNNFYSGAIVSTDVLATSITAQNNVQPNNFHDVYLLCCGTIYTDLGNGYIVRNGADILGFTNDGTTNSDMFPLFSPIGVSATLAYGNVKSSSTKLKYNPSTGNLSSSITTLGTSGSIVGKTIFNNATTGTITLQPDIGALGSSVLTLPIATDTLIGKATNDVLTNKSISGSTNTLSNIANASLTNSSTTVNGQTCTLGASCTVTAAATSITVGSTTVGSGTNTRILFNNAGTLGEYVISGSGNVAMTTNPVFTTPALGTPSALVLTNATGTPNSIGLTNGTGLPTTGLTGTLQAAQEPAHTGDVTNSAGSLALTIANNAVTFAKMATQATNTIVGNATSGTAVPTALAIGSCSTASSALIWTTNTGFGCNTSITASAVAVGGITGLGTGVATALALNVGSAGAPVTFNGAGGTPSSLTLTNATGLPTAGLVNSAVTNAKLANMATTTIKGQTVGGSGDPVDLTATQAATILATVGGVLKTKTITISRDLTLASGSVAYTGCGFSPTSLHLTGAVNLSAPNVYITYSGFSDSSLGQRAVFGSGTANNGINGNIIAAFVDATGAANQTAAVASYDADGFTITWTKTGSPTGTATSYVLCTR